MSTKDPSSESSVGEERDGPLYWDAVDVDGADVELSKGSFGGRMGDLEKANLQVSIHKGNVTIYLNSQESDETYAGAAIDLTPDAAQDLGFDLIDAARRASDRDD